MMRALTALRSLLAPVAIGMALTGTALAPTSAHAEQFLSLYHRPDLKWYTIETEHFLVHYPVSRKSKDKAKHYVNGEWAARKVAKVSEQYYGPMCAEFDYYLEEKTHIVVLEQYDQLQGFTIPARNWVEISGNPGPTFYRSRSRSEWFSNVLVHEFAHVVSLKKNQATAENVPATLVSALYRNNALGQDGRDLDTESGAQLVITDRTEPWWWTEGGAEYWSSTTGYNWWTAGRERTVRNSVIEDRLLTYDEWKSTQFGILSWGDGERGYQQGHSIALYMRMRFGPEAFASFAIEADKAWRAHWETIIEEKTGVGARQLYDDWRAWIEDYYERMYDELVAEGEAVGRSLDADQGMRFDTPAERDRFFTRTRKVWGQERKEPKERIDWETQLDRTGSYEGWPKISEDGRWFGEGGRSLSITAQPERFIGAHGEPWRSDVANAGARANASFMTGVYPTGFVSGWDFVPGQDQVVAVMRENTIDRARKGFYAIDIETDGYDWDNLVLIDLEPFIREKVRHGDQRVELPTLRPKKRRGSGFDATYRQKPRMPFRVIPNTQRGTEPAVSPDGQTVAYLEYGDGTNNLVLIGLDGSNKRYMTEFSSGELIQSVDWSPDGKTLVFALFKNYKSDIWFMDVETGEVRPFTQDRLEELDVHWSPHDGNLYFAADHENIYNVYRYDFDTGRIDQLTNVISTAYMPHLTPSGDLLYMNYTAFGQKNYVLAQEEFLELDATERFDIDLDEAETGRAMADFAYTEDLSEFEPLTKRYASFRRFHPPAIIPIFRLRNPSLPTFALDTGVQVSSFDVGEKHEFLGVGIVGTNMVLGGGYTYRGWHPEISIFAQHAQTKADFGFLIDEDDDRSTLDDQEVYEFRQNTYQNALFLSANYAVNQQLRLRGQVGVFEFGFRSINDKQFRPFNLSTTARLGFEFSNLNYGLQVGRLNFSRRGINPRGRYVTFDYTLGYTDHVSPNNNGVNTDDGERLDAYVYNRFDFRWTEHLPFPFVRRLRSSGHALQFDVQAAAIDRNVQLFDELRAGGGHPMMPGVGPGGVQPTQPLSGYPTVLLGETMAVASAYWRFPIKRNIQKKWGPLLMRDLYVQAGGSAGNLWSFQPPDEDEVGLYYFDNQGNRVAFDPDDVEREIPLVDRAYKNGNYLLTDVSAELRVSSVLMGTQFNSILRVSYGFNEVSGIFDIDGDDINDTTNAGFGNAISAETEKPGPRIYLGIGSGW